MRGAAAGRLVTLEGGEGVGKSSLARALGEALEARGLRVVRTREPGGSPGADAIRALIVTGSEDRWSTLSETLLLSAARCDHLERVIRPALAAGAIVICDRFTDSTRAYQVAARGLPAADLETLNALIDAPRPDLTLILDADPAMALARAQSARLGEARYEAMAAPFHQAVRAAFLAIAAAEPQRCVVIDAGRPMAQVQAEAIAAAMSKLGLTAA